MAETSEAYRPIVRHVTVTPEGITIEYTIPAKDNLPSGLGFNHMVFLPDDTYDEVNATIRKALKLAVQAALVDAGNPKNTYHLPPDDEADDDTVGPYEYPPNEPGAAHEDRTNEDRQARSEAVAPAGDETGARALP